MQGQEERGLLPLLLRGSTRKITAAVQILTRSLFTCI
jgi:hypothetical protein